MLSLDMRNVFLLLFMTSLHVPSSYNKIILRNDVPKWNGQIKTSYANLLSSLIKINEERVKILRKLYILNSVDYGKKILRSSIENRLNSYDEMQERLMKILKHLLSDKSKYSSEDSTDIYDILQSKELIIALPIEKHVMDKEQPIRDVKRALRKIDDDEKVAKYPSSTDDSDSESVEKQNEEDATGNKTKSRSYYYEYTCGRGRIRCIKACKETYRDACYEEYCESDLRRSLRKGCKRECRDWFY